MKITIDMPESEYKQIVDGTLPVHEVQKVLESIKAGEVESTDPKQDVKAEVETVDFGATIELGGIKMEVIDHDHDSTGQKVTGVMCLAKEILFNMAFDDDDRNNWYGSSLREYLNGKYYKEILAEELSEAIIPYTRDLTSNDGLKDYGSCVDVVSLISCDEYRRLRGRISNKKTSWWTLTAYSADTDMYYYFDTCVVERGGRIDHGHAFGKDGGVCPLFMIASGTKVRIVDAD